MKVMRVAPKSVKIHERNNKRNEILWTFSVFRVCVCVGMQSFSVPSCHFFSFCRQQFPKRQNTSEQWREPSSKRDAARANGKTNSKNSIMALIVWWHSSHVSVCTLKRFCSAVPRHEIQPLTSPRFQRQPRQSERWSFTNALDVFQCEPIFEWVFCDELISLWILISK